MVRSFVAGISGLFILCHVTIAVADDRAVAERLRATGAEISLDDQGFVTSFRLREAGKLTLDDFREIGRFKKLKSLALSGGRTLNDDHLATLKDLAELERATLDGIMLTDDGLRHLAGWKNLRKLTFYNITNRGKFNGAGMAYLAELPKFEQFACGGSSFDDAGLEACSRLTHLTDLQLWHTPITDAGVSHLTKLHALKHLRLLAQWRPRITDAALPHLAKIKSLESLSIGETRFSWEVGLKHLSDLPNLKKLELYQVEINESDRNAAKQALPKVQVDWSPIAEKYVELFEQNWKFQRK